MPAGAPDWTRVTVPAAKPAAARACVAPARVRPASGGRARSPVVAALMFPAKSVSVNWNVRGSPAAIGPIFVSNCVASKVWYHFPST